MSNFFDIDGPFFKYGTILADILVITMIWFITSIFIFTSGASTTALFYIMTKKANDRDDYLLKSYFKSFKDNFLQSTIIWFIFTIFLILISYNIYLISNQYVAMDNTIFSKVIYLFQFTFLFELIITSLYAYPLLSRYELKTKDIIKTSFILSNKHIFSSILLILIIVLVVFLIYIHPLFLLGSIGLYSFFASKIFVRIFKKYTPEMDEYAVPEQKSVLSTLNDSSRRIIESSSYLIPKDDNSKTNEDDNN